MVLKITQRAEVVRTLAGSPPSSIPVSNAGYVPMATTSSTGAPPSTPVSTAGYVPMPTEALKTPAPVTDALAAHYEGTPVGAPASTAGYIPIPASPPLSAHYEGTPNTPYPTPHYEAPVTTTPRPAAHYDAPTTTTPHPLPRPQVIQPYDPPSPPTTTPPPTPPTPDVTYQYVDFNARSTTTPPPAQPENNTPTTTTPSPSRVDYNSPTTPGGDGGTDFGPQPTMSVSPTVASTPSTTLSSGGDLGTASNSPSMDVKGVLTTIGSNEPSVTTSSSPSAVFNDLPRTALDDDAPSTVVTSRDLPASTPPVPSGMDVGTSSSSPSILGSSTTPVPSTSQTPITSTPAGTVRVAVTVVPDVTTTLPINASTIQSESTTSLVNASTPSLPVDEATVTSSPTTEDPMTTPPATQQVKGLTPAPVSGNGSAKNRADVISGGNNKDTILVVMGIIAICIGLIVIVAFFVRYRRRRRCQPLDLTTPAAAGGPHTSTHAQFTKVLERPAITLGPMPSDFRSDRVLLSVRLPLNTIELGRILSRGAFGEVLKAKYRDQVVVIKRLNVDRRLERDQILLFAREIRLMATLEHPRIVRLIGAAWDAPSTLCAVTEYMDGGDVRTLLSQWHDDGRPVGFNPFKIKIALDIVKALVYLHSRTPKIIHRDLKSTNVVLSATGDAKLTDFGVSRERSELTMTSAVGSSLWMAPEVIASGHYDEKADIFSFGVLLSELDTQMLPYRYGTQLEAPVAEVALLQMVETGSLRVSFTGPETDPMKQIGYACVAVDPHHRPTAIDLCVRLQTLVI